MVVKKYYDYEPSFVAAVVFAALFGITSLFHTYQLLRTHLWFWIPFVIGGIFELVGFAAHSYNANEEMYEWTFAAFVVQTLGLLLAPVLFAASMYMLMGRIAELARGESLLIVRRSWLTKIFVGGDILAFLVQVIGGIMLTQQDIKKTENGRKIVLVGLWLQIVFFGFFLLNAILFFVRMGRNEKKSNTPARTPWRKHLISLFTASSLILARCIYRVIEYQQGKKGYLMTHEVFVYVLDGGLMLIVMVIFHLAHPSEIRARLRGGRMAHLWKTVSVQKSEYDSVCSEAGFQMGHPQHAV